MPIQAKLIERYNFKLWGIAFLLCAQSVLAREDAWPNLQQTRLEDGLTVWSLPRPESATVSLRVVVRLGFRDETQDTYGLAHFLEHTLFTDTSRHSEKQIKAFIPDHGGRWNGYTHLDRTVYLCDLPASQLESGVLWLGEILTDCQFSGKLEERLRREVREEYRNSYAVLPPGLEWVRDATGWGTSADLASAALFPDSGVVLRSTRLGPVLDGLTLEQARETWNKSYVNLNMALIGVGNLEHGRLVELARQAFQRRGPAPELSRRSTPGRAGKRLEFREALPSLGRQAGLLLALRTEGISDPGHAAATVALRMLRERVEAEAVDRGALTSGVAAFSLETADVGVSLLYSLHEEPSQRQLRQVLERALEELAAGRETMEEFRRAREAARGELLRRFEENAELAEALTEQWIAAGGRETTPPDPVAAVEAVTREQARTAAARMFAPQNQLWLAWEPLFSLAGVGKALAGGLLIGLLFKLLRRRRRKARLATALLLGAAGGWAGAGEAQEWDVRRAEAPGGPEIWLCERPGARTVALELVVRSGLIPEEAEMLRRMLVAGAGGMEESEVKTALEGLGGLGWCSSDAESIRIGAQAPPEHAREALEWIAAVAGKPRFEQRKFEAKLGLALERRRWNAALDLLWFGGRLERMIEERIYEGCRLSDAEALRGMEVQRLRELHRKVFQRGAMTLTAAGPISMDWLRPAAAWALRGLPPGGGAPAEPCSNAKMPEGGWTIVDRWPKLTGRSTVTLGFLTRGAADPDRWALALARTLLQEEAFDRIRNGFGLAYGARAAHELHPGRGVFSISTDVEPENREQAIGLLREALKLGSAQTRQGPEAPGPPDLGLEKARARLLGAFVRQRDTTLGVMQGMAALAALQEYGLPVPDPVARIQQVTPEQIRDAVDRLLERPGFVAYSAPVLTGQRLVVLGSCGLLLGAASLLWLRRRRRTKAHAGRG